MGLHDCERSDMSTGVHVGVAGPIVSVVEIEPSRPAIIDQVAVMLFARDAKDPLVCLREAT